MSSSEHAFLQSLGAIPAPPSNAFSMVMRRIKQRILFVRLAWLFCIVSVALTAGVISFLPHANGITISAEVIDEARYLQDYFNGVDIQEEGRLYLAMDESVLH